jgi:hypothetical protein
MQLHKLVRQAVVLVLVSGSASALAQVVYRCANLYSDTPCPGAVPIDASDSRTPEQKAHSDHATRQTAALADRMEHDRNAAARPPRVATPASRPHATASAPRATGLRTVDQKLKPPPRQRPVGEPFTATARSDKPPAPVKPARPAATTTAAARP